MKHLFNLVLLAVAIAILVLSIRADKARNAYWNSQFEQCGRAGFYIDGNECVPVDYLK